MAEARRLELALVRHAAAAARGPDWPDDSLRPLVPKGRRQAVRMARALARAEAPFDRLLSSPYTRAAETAEALAGVAVPGRPEWLDALAGDDPASLTRELAARLEPGDARVLLVGHEPHLSELASWLLAGDAAAVELRVRKGALVLLAGGLEPGGMRLEALLTARWLKRLEGK